MQLGGICGKIAGTVASCGQTAIFTGLYRLQYKGAYTASNNKKGCHYSTERNGMFRTVALLSGMEQLFNISLHKNSSCLGLWSDICSY